MANQNSSPRPGPGQAASSSGTGGNLTLNPQVITLDPVSRIEGHLKINVKVDTVGGRLEVVDAWSTGTLFRGAENILNGRHPWDAVPITQRICGVCPVAHGDAAVRAIDALTGVNVPDNGRILRNLVLGANYLQDHILHFYHLSILDYVDGPNMPPWQPSWSADKRFDQATSDTLVSHYLTALDMRRKGHEAGAIFGGRMPAPPAFVPGGFTSVPSSARIAALDAHLNHLIPFIRDVYIPDAQLVASVYSDYDAIGGGPGNLLVFGVFDLDGTGANKFFPGGRVEAGSTNVLPLDINAVTEDATCAWYENSSSPLPPASGRTVAKYPKPYGYSWLKAPRYGTLPFEVGPLARMWIRGDYRRGISVNDRNMARAEEALSVAQAMKTWLTQLNLSAPVYTNHTLPQSGSGFGLTEAARGGLGHWIEVQNSKISHDQIVTPTCWNSSPRDRSGVRGPIEQALIGTPVGSTAEPVEVLRVVHSFDPCLACAVHVMRAEGKDVTVLKPG